MRVLIDTNILISAALSSKGTPYKAFLKEALDEALENWQKTLTVTQNRIEVKQMSYKRKKSPFDCKTFFYVLLFVIQYTATNCIMLFMSIRLNLLVSQFLDFAEFYRGSGMKRDEVTAEGI